MDRSFPMAIGEFATGDTSIFWDVEDASILDGLDPYSIFQNIKSALENKGYRGPLSIRAYIDENTLPKDFTTTKYELAGVQIPKEFITTKYELAGIQIVFVPEGDRYSRVRSMLMEILFWAMKRRIIDEDSLCAIYTPSTLVVLSKDIQEDTMYSTLHDRVFKYPDYNVIVAPRESLISVNEKQITLPPNQIVFVISGPSGAGRDAVINKFREVRKVGLHFAVTITTNRHMTTSPGEDYSLVERHEFLRMFEKDELLHYNVEKGISKKEIHEFMAKSEDIVVRVDDILEAQYLRLGLLGSAVFIYLVAESDLSTPVKSEELLSLAREEAWHLNFDYVVVNTKGKLDDAVNCLESIIDSEKSKFHQKIVMI